MNQQLIVYFEQQKMGLLEQNKQGRLQFTYDVDYLRQPNAMALSYTMPLSSTVYQDSICQPFFTGILPEGHARSLIAKKLGITASNDFALLAALGGECVGAISLQTGELSSASSRHYLALDTTKLADIFAQLPRRPLLVGETDLRLSLAGAQNKIAVKIDDTGMYLPLENSPSTHILKPELSGFDGSVANEAYCLMLAKLVGIVTVEAKIAIANTTSYLAVKRYDRIIVEQAIKRLHQEDFCQALSISPNFKYQNEGGPSLIDAFTLIREYSSIPAQDSLQLLDLVIFNFLIGNNDAHGKNFSFLYQDKQIQLAPAYDLLCTRVYPELSTNQAMKIGGTYRTQDIYRDNFIKLAKEVGISPKAISKRINQMIEYLLAAYQTIAIEHPIIEKIQAIIRGNILRLQQD